MLKKTKVWVATALSVALAGGATLRAMADDKTAPPAASQPAAGGTTARATRHRGLVEPWSKMKTLTPEQTAQIEKLHADSVEQQDKIKQKERDDIDALLKPDQLKEADEIDAARKEATKERAVAKHMATTKPTK